jgi:hypothetical protein
MKSFVVKASVKIGENKIIRVVTIIDNFNIFNADCNSKTSRQRNFLVGSQN